MMSIYTIRPPSNWIVKGGDQRKLLEAETVEFHGLTSIYTILYTIFNIQPRLNWNKKFFYRLKWLNLTNQPPFTQFLHHFYHLTLAEYTIFQSLYSHFYHSISINTIFTIWLSIYTIWPPCTPFKLQIHHDFKVI